MVGGLLGNFLLIPPVNAQTSYTQATHMPDHPTVPIQNLSQGVIDSNGRKIFYWVQISDIHINAEKDLERVTFFDQFCDHVNSTIKPAFVISSGDNVDAREETIWMFYAQDENENRLFNQTLQKYDFNASFWYNMLGNHERYDTELNFSLFQTHMRNETQYGVDFNPGFG